MEDKELIYKFEEYLYAIKNYSNYTVNGYVKDVTDFAQFLRENKFASKLLDVKRSKTCHYYVSHLVRKGYVAKSINRKITTNIYIDNLHLQ